MLNILKETPNQYTLFSKHSRKFKEIIKYLLKALQLSECLPFRWKVSSWHIKKSNQAQKRLSLLERECQRNNLQQNSFLSQQALERRITLVIGNACAEHGERILEIVRTDICMGSKCHGKDFHLFCCWCRQFTSECTRIWETQKGLDQPLPRQGRSAFIKAEWYLLGNGSFLGYVDKHYPISSADFRGSGKTLESGHCLQHRGQPPRGIFTNIFLVTSFHS